MKSFKKMIVWALALIMIISLCPVSGVWAESALSPLPETEGVTRVGIFADSHVGNEAGSKKMETTLQTFSTLAPDYAGLAMTGDIIVQYGTVADDYAVDSAPYDYVLSDLSTYASGKPYSWAMGNHEFPGACVLAVSQSETQTALMETAIETSKNYYVDKTGMSLNDDVLIGGYHFISAAPIDYSNCFDAQAEQYIMERIDAAIEADGNEKPIFLNIHHAPWYTTLSSTETVYNIPYSETFTTYLEQHPNVVIFTGHTHNSQYDPRTIWQGGYTVVNVGHTSNGSGASVSGEIVYDRSNQEAIMMEISADNVVTLKKIDVENQCYIGEDWVLDIPNMVKNPGNTDYWKYTESKSDGATTPYFEEGDVVTMNSSSLTTATLSFPQAKIETYMGDDIIRYYNVKIINKKLQTLVQDYNISADFYNPPSKRANPFVFTVDELDANTEYIAEIYAVSPYNKKSGVISGIFKTANNDEESTSSATSPEDDTRNPVYKYIATTDGEGNVVTLYNELNTPGRNTKGYNKDSRFGFGNYYIAMYESGNYITFELDVEESGLYELMGIGANNKSSDLGVYIDGFKKGTFTVPVNENGPFGDSKYDATYAPIDEYLLEAGTHTITFKLEQQANSQLLLWGVALAKVENAYVDYMYCTEGAPIAGHYADYSAAKDVMAYQFYGDGWGYIDFTVDVPTNGEYILNAETGGSKEGNTFAVFVDSFPSSYNTTTATTFIDIPAITSPVLNTIVTCPANNTLKLSAGTHKIRLWAGTVCAPYLRSISLVNYDTSDKWSVYHTSSSNVTSFANGGSGDNDLTNGLIMMRPSGYITYQYTPAVSGKYNLSWDMIVGGCYGQTFVNGEAVTEKTLYNQSRGYSDPIEVVFSAGNTYDITFKAVESETTYFFTMHNLKVEYAGAPDNGGEGIYYDLYAGDSDRDNYEAQGASSLKYGDGRNTNGWGCYGGLYTEYDFNIEYPGFYDLNLVLGAAGEAIVTASIDGQEILTQNANYVSGENWSVKRDNDFGEVFLLEGNHTLRITGGDGNFQIYKTRIAFDRVDDGRAELSFMHEAVDYLSKGGSNVQTYTSPYGGVVLGEGGSYTEYVVDVPAGNYAFEICYGANNWDGQMSITLNGAMLGTYALPQNNTSLHFANYDRTSYYTPEILSLNEGVNKIKLRCEKFPNGSGYAYFSFSTFKLTRITEPTVQLYHGEYIIPGTQQTALADGDNTVRVYMPAYVEGEAVSLFACIYENGRLYKLDKVDVSSAGINEVMIALLEDVKLDTTKNYTLKVFNWSSAEGMMPICEEISVIG